MPNKPTTLRESLMNEYIEFCRMNPHLFPNFNTVTESGDWWLDKFDSHNTELIRKIEGLKSESISINQAVYNRAMDEVIKLINQEK